MKRTTSAKTGKDTVVSAGLFYSKAITVLLILSLMLMPMVALTACRGSRNLTIDDIEDVSPDDWFYRYVVAGIRFGIIRGERGEGFRFEPDENITLGEFVTMLGRLHEYGHGTIGTPGEGPDHERYYIWAKEEGIILDHPDWEDLTPYTLINREQKAVIVFLYIDAFELRDYFANNYNIQMLPFWDHNKMSPWSRGIAMRLSVMVIMGARDEQYFRPCHPVSHAEALRITIRITSAIYDLVHPLPRQ